MRDHVLLYINGRPTRVGGADVFLTLSDFLRRRQGLTGTKVVCAEGDCGSCAALIGRLDGDTIRYSAITSCIQLMLQLDGTHVVTIEGLRDGGELNAVQQAMVKCQGTQCGFCTPGFVVSMCDLMQDGKPLDTEKARRGLVGNLCRCTGYDSILRAAVAVEPGALKSIDARYPPDQIIAALSMAASEEVLIQVGERRFYKPTTVEAAVRIRGENPQCSVIAGATDLGVVYNKRIKPIDVALSLSAIRELRGISFDEGVMVVGSGTTLSALERAALQYLPELGQFLAYFGSPLIKNAGTLGGNIANGSPIGDTIPALMALQAEVELAGIAGRRRVPMNEFYAGYRTTVARPDELVTAIRIPLPRPGEIFKLYKVSRRKDLDISSFGAAFWMKRDAAGVVEDVRIYFGGVGPMVLRMARTEEVIRGQSPTLARFEDAARVARDEVTPITDVRGSETYRRMLSANILLKFWHDAIGDNHRSNGDGDGNGWPANDRTAGVSPALIRE